MRTEDRWDQLSWIPGSWLGGGEIRWRQRTCTYIYIVQSVFFKLGLHYLNFALIMKYKFSSWKFLCRYQDTFVWRLKSLRCLWCYRASSFVVYYSSPCVLWFPHAFLFAWLTLRRPLVSMTSASVINEQLLVSFHEQSLSWQRRCLRWILCE